MWAFPLIGAFLGLLAGLFGWVAYQFLPGLVVGALVLALLLLMTGLHHMDGLLDFGDGVMAHGTPEHKIAVMHDQFTGAGAIGLCLMTYLITAFAFVELGMNLFFGNYVIPLILPALIVVELCAKLSMVVAARAGKSSPPRHELSIPRSHARVRRQLAFDCGFSDFFGCCLAFASLGRCFHEFWRLWLRV